MPSPSTLAGWLGWAGRHACRSMRAGPDPLRPGAARAARPAVDKTQGTRRRTLDRRLVGPRCGRLGAMDTDWWITGRIKGLRRLLPPPGRP